jgi:hypothetical protein
MHVMDGRNLRVLVVGALLASLWLPASVRAGCKECGEKQPFHYRYYIPLQGLRSYFPRLFHNPEADTYNPTPFEPVELSYDIFSSKCPTVPPAALYPHPYPPRPPQGPPPATSGYR